MRLLRLRLRSDRLSPERLRIAALLGDPASLSALGDDAPAPALELGSYLRRLDDEEAICRGVVALGWCMLPLWERTFPDAAEPRVALALCGGWLESGGPVGPVVEGSREAQNAREFAREAVRLAAEAAEPTAGVAGLVVSREDDWARCADGLGLTADDLLTALIVACSGPPGEASLDGVIGSAFQRPVAAVGFVVLSCTAVEGLALSREGSPKAPGRRKRLQEQVGTLARAAGREVGSDGVRRALAASIVPWALGD